MNLSEAQIYRQKEVIISLLLSTKRTGIDRVIGYLEESGYFTAPSSATRHHNWRGGLAQHSLEVYQEAAHTAPSTLPKESLIIAGLLHDLCKAHQFYIDQQGRICERRLHILGHGYRSVKLLQNLEFRLSEDERLAIRYHMHQSSIRAHDTEKAKALHSPLRNIINRADGRSAGYRVKLQLPLGKIQE